MCLFQKDLESPLMEKKKNKKEIQEPKWKKLR